MSATAILAGVDFVTGIAGTLMDTAAERKQADLDEANRLANNKQIRLNTVKEYEGLTEQKAVADRATMANSMAAKKAAMSAIASSKVQAGAAGSFGGSVDAAMRDLQVTGGTNLKAISQNHETKQRELAYTAEKINRDGQARLDNTVIKKPTWSGAFLGILSGAGVVGAGAAIGLDYLFGD